MRPTFRIFGLFARQLALQWHSVGIQIVVGGLKCYHPSMKWILSKGTFQQYITLRATVTFDLSYQNWVT